MSTSLVLGVPEDASRNTRRSLQGLRKRLWAADPSCVYCGQCMPLRRATLDHLIPLSQGGSHHPENVVLACWRCNQTKGAAMPREWLDQLTRTARVLERIISTRGY